MSATSRTSGTEPEVTEVQWGVTKDGKWDDSTSATSSRASVPEEAGLEDDCTRDSRLGFRAARVFIFLFMPSFFLK